MIPPDRIAALARETVDQIEATTRDGLDAYDRILLILQEFWRQVEAETRAQCAKEQK
jgi:hypothetical protein